LKKVYSKISYLLVIFTLAVACVNKVDEDMSKKSSSKEVRDHKGEALSSGDDFRENSIKGPQQIDQKSYRLKITGLVKNPKTYTSEEVIKHQSHQKVVTLDCVEGWSVTLLWEGPLVRDLLNGSHPMPGATTLVFTSSDGFTTSVPLTYVMNNSIILASKMNNVTIPPQRGFPFQLVAEGKWGYKWSKWVIGIEVIDNPNYKGFWESRGYSISGDLNQSFSGG
jgi:DMSO/TMAO reductase YedYZ molybdopterin-dependent catalytic subunit